jgi:hypothetical protein
MQSTNLQFKINNLKDVLANFSNEEKRMIGVTIIRENTSDNWLFNTDVDITEIVPVVTSALQKEIADLEVQLPALIQADNIARQQKEAEELAQKQAEQLAIEQQKQAEWDALILKQKEILLAQDEARKIIEAEKLSK